MQNIFQWFVLFGVYVSETAANYADLYSVTSPKVVIIFIFVAPLITFLSKLFYHFVGFLVILNTFPF